ncbi:yqaJ domain-containing protein [Trichonephila clavipes]|nr:yqaJ domain-containing protein [Trichonephila clavipes]
MENHLSKLKVQNIYDLESETRGQASSERWRYERSLRLSSSFFKEIACRKNSTPCSKLVVRIVYGRDLCNAAMKYGLANEEIARKQYEREYSTEVKICGLFVDKDKPFLCASPDGLVGDDGLIEIKCPYSARFESNLLEFLITKKKKKKNSLGFKFSNERGIYLPLNHKFYFQIQGQLFITNGNGVICIYGAKGFVNSAYRGKRRVLERNYSKTIEKFYFKCVLPEILDVRAPPNMPLRGAVICRGI